MSAPKGIATYVVQVYSPFSPPHLTPLLVRLAESATVGEAIHASLSRLLEQDPSVILPSDLVSEYTLRCAGGEGQPLYQSLAFDHSSVLREASGLEFPFMVYMGYSAGGAPRTADGGAYSASGTNNSAEGGGDGGGVLGGARGRRHVPLSAIEKAALETHRREIEARREENIKQIERKRFEQQMAAFHHSENYELKRREEAEKKAAEDLRAEQERALRAKEEMLSRARDEESRKAQLAAVKQGNAKVVEEMRKEMQNAIAGDAKRREELAEALAIRRREEQHAADMERERKRLFLEAQKKQRTEEDFARLIGELDSVVQQDVSHIEEHVSSERHRRQLFQRADADAQAIALIEQQRNYIKLNSRLDRKGKEEADQQRFALLCQQREAAEREEESRTVDAMLEWQERQDARREQMTSQIEADLLRSKLGIDGDAPRTHSSHQ